MVGGSMKVINLLPEHLHMLSTISNAKSIDMDVVQNCYDQHPKVFDHLRNDILIHKEIGLTAIEEIGAAELYRHVEDFNSKIDERLSSIIHKLSLVFDISILDNEIYITLGNNTTNAIVTWYGSGALFLFAEKISLAYLDIIATHEITHLIQRRIYSSIEDILLIDLLYAEGVACYFSKVINPGYSTSEYLNFNTDSSQDLNLDFIKVKCVEIENDFNRNEPEIIARYLSGFNQYNDWISRVGYFIGFMVVEEIARTRNDKAILRLDLMESRSAFREVFQKLIK